MRTACLLLVCAAMIPLPVDAATSKQKPFVQTGLASWYGNNFKGHKMANGERYNPDDLTAAHRSLPLGTMVRVTRLSDSLSVVVRITNRGPFIKGRIIDLSTAAARKLDMMHSGVARVRIEIVQ
jgi:rare lipoprotein A